MLDYDEYHGRNVNQNTLGVKWKGRMIKRIIFKNISDKKQRQLEFQKLDMLPYITHWRYKCSCLKIMNE